MLADQSLAVDALLVTADTRLSAAVARTALVSLVRHVADPDLEAELTA